MYLASVTQRSAITIQLVVPPPNPPFDMVQYINRWQNANQFILAQPRKGYCGYCYGLVLTPNEWLFFQRENDIVAKPKPRRNGNDGSVFCDRILFRIRKQNQIPKFAGHELQIARQYDMIERVTGLGLTEHQKKKPLK